MMVCLLIVLGVNGRAIDEHIMTEEEPFLVTNVYWYKEYSDGPENPLTCTPVMYRYHVILTRSKYPDKNVKEIVQNYVEENNIEGLYKQDPSGIFFIINRVYSSNILNFLDKKMLIY